MAKVERTGEVAGKSASEVYEIAVEAFEANGFNVWKKRPNCIFWQWCVLQSMVLGLRGT